MWTPREAVLDCLLSDFDSHFDFNLQHNYKRFSGKYLESDKGFQVQEVS